MRLDWSYLSYVLATRGIPSDWSEEMSGDYESDPWRPAPNSEVVTFTISKPDAERLIALLARPGDTR
jgi:hypothetical protein